MQAGRIVFDGTPDQLTAGVVRDIYGAGADFSETMTSTAITPQPAPVPTALEKLGAAAWP